MKIRVAVGLVIWVLVSTSVAACSGDDAAPSTASHTGESTEAAESADRVLAGRIGPNGGVMDGAHEMQSTPESLYPHQAQGATAVGPVAALPGGLSVLRHGDRICLELHGLPIGAALVAVSCEMPAYKTPAEVEDVGHAYVSDALDEDGQLMRVAWGMTYLDAATVDFGAGSMSQKAETHFPFWMHRFFALPVPPDGGRLRIVDEAGRELASFPLEDPG